MWGGGDQGVWMIRGGGVGCGGMANTYPLAFFVAEVSCPPSSFLLGLVVTLQGTDLLS